MTAAIEGFAHVYGDAIDTDLLAPGAYLKGPIENMAKHCLEAIDPEFVTRAREGDILVAGAQFGSGSSREQAVQSLLLNGIRVVIAVSFGRIFYRNALNLGLPALICPTAREIVSGSRLRVDPIAGTASEIATGRVHRCEPIPAHLMEMISDGGLLAHLEKKLRAKQAALKDIN